MDVKKLVVEGRTEPEALACGKCGIVFRLKDEAWAEKCCKPTVCKCGELAQKHYTACQPCMDRRDQEKEKAKFDKAEKLTFAEYKGEYVYHETLPSDGFIQAEALEDTLSDMESDGCDRPLYVWACNPQSIGKIDADWILESTLDEYHEEAIELVDVEALQKALDQWVSEQPKDLSYFPTGVAILLDGLTPARGSEKDE